MYELAKAPKIHRIFFQKQENQPEEEKSSVSQDKSEDESGKIVFKVKCHHDSMIPTIKTHETLTRHNYILEYNLTRNSILETMAKPRPQNISDENQCLC